MLILRMVRVGLIFVVSSWLVQPLTVGVGLLNANANVAGRVGGASGALRTWLGHGRIHDEALGHVSRIVGVTIVSGVWIVVRNRGRRVDLLRTLPCGRLGLLVGSL